MPIHDWSRVDSGIFHHFHQAWTIEIANSLNDGGLPQGFFALAEQIVGGPIPLESTYASTWSRCPEPVREIVENPIA